MDKVVLSYFSGTVFEKPRRKDKIILEDVSFTIEEGKSLALIGETGSGKTMTALSLMKLLPPGIDTEGQQIIFMGSPLTKNMKDILGVTMVYIPQSGLEFLNPSKKIKYHLYDNLKKLGVPKTSFKNFAAEVLALAGLQEPLKVLEMYPFQLSGGMAQKVTIAVSACSDARLLIADEPTNGLDYDAKLKFNELLKKLFPKASVLLITHDIQVASFCDDVIVLCKGRMMEKGRAEVVLSHPNHPYTGALLNSLVANGMKESPVLRCGDAVCPFYKRCILAEEACKKSVSHFHNDNGEWWCRER